MNTQKEIRQNKINTFLNTFFDTPTGYSEKEINNHYLVRFGGEKLIIAIYTKENYLKYKNYTKK